MVNRRELLQIGAALGILPLARVTSANPAPTGGAPLYKVIFDSRTATGRSFGTEIARIAAPHVAHAIEGDVTDVWYRDLYPRWKRSPAAIAGLTDYAAAFCLERLAWDFGMRTVFRADHEIRSESDAGPRIARAIAELPAGLRAVAPLGPAPERLNGGSPLLVAWMIAPVERT